MNGIRTSVGTIRNVIKRYGPGLLAGGMLRATALHQSAEDEAILTNWMLLGRIGIVQMAQGSCSSEM
jgi:hypothetical protein